MKAALGILVATLMTLVCARAEAFHAGSMFNKAPGAGGGGGVFYAGAPKDHGWNCRACHNDAEGRIRVTLDSPDLFASFQYAPGKTYSLTATMLGEWKGIGSQANFNGLTVQVVDASGAPVGQLQAPADDFYATGAATIASAGQKTNQASWTFKWTAPPTGSGRIRIFVAAVDGNGAGKSSGTLTDPFGDDVFTGAIAVDEGAQANRARQHREGLLVGLLAVALRIRRRRS